MSEITMLETTYIAIALKTTLHNDPVVIISLEKKHVAPKGSVVR